MELTDVVPFLIEDEFQRLGGHYEKGPDWAPFVVEDGKLITGQNPASSEGVAQALVAQVLHTAACSGALIAGATSAIARLQHTA